MDRNEFLKRLKAELHGLPEDDINKTLDYYSEMIDDAIEDGGDEREVIAGLGDVHDIAEKIINDTPLTKLVKENIKGHKLNTAAIILIILGSPVWFSLLVSILSVIAAIYMTLWTAVISFWAVFAALAVSGPVAVVLVGFLLVAEPLKAMFMAGAALMCMGMAVFMFFISLLFTKLLIKLTVFVIRKIKNGIMKRGGGEYENK